MINLPAIFLTVPLAHRGLHDRSAGRVENSRAAIQAAVTAGYGVEIDLQLSADGEAMVFHDYVLDRLTPDKGATRQRKAHELQAIPLIGAGANETIPTLSEVLEIVAGQVPLLLEIKDQDGALGPDTGELEKACAKALAGYEGPVALMSFNPHAVAVCANYAPDIPRGLAAGKFPHENWPLVPEKRLEELRSIPDFHRVGASFISHGANDLNNPRVAYLKAQGAAILCWTICSVEDEMRARHVADNITFESYLPAGALA